MEEVGAGVVAHRPGAPVRSRPRRDSSSPTRTRPWSVPRWTIRPPDRPLGVRHLEDHRAIRAAEHAPIADLAAALGVERRPVEDDLGLGARLGPLLRVAVGSQLVVLDAVADDRPHDRPAPTSSRSRGTWSRRPAGRSTRRGPSARHAGRARPCARSDSARAARRAPPRTPPGRRPTPYSAASSIVRSIGNPIRVVEAERNVAGQHGRVRRQLLGPPTDDPFGGRQRDERLLELGRPGVERPGELGLLAHDRAEDRRPAARRG